MKCSICQRDLPIEKIVCMGGICEDCWPKYVEEHEERMKAIRARTGSKLPPRKFLCDGEWLSESEYLARLTND